MSDRPYLPESNETGPIASREYKKFLAQKVRRGLIYGYPSDSNPLGLYQFVVTSYDGVQPRRSLTEYCLPYEVPDQNTIDSSRLFEICLQPDEYEFAASLVFGGLLRYAQTRSDLTADDLQIINDTEMLNFTTALTFRLLRQTARCAIQHLGAASVEDIAAICSDSYYTQVGLLTKMKSYIAQSTEYQIGVSTLPDRFVNTGAKILINQDSETVDIEVEQGYAGDKTMCSGAIENQKGDSYAKSMWHRCIQVCSSIPWLFEAEINGSK